MTTRTKAKLNQKKAVIRTISNLYSQESGRTGKISKEEAQRFSRSSANKKSTHTTHTKTSTYLPGTRVKGTGKYGKVLGYKTSNDSMKETKPSIKKTRNVSNRSSKKPVRRKKSEDCRSTVRKKWIEWDEKQKQNKSSDGF